MISRAGEVAAIVLCVVTLGVIAITEISSKDPKIESFVPVFDGDIPETEGPVTYFLTNCGRCHGPAEDAYVEFPNPRRGEALRAMIKHMASTLAMSASDDQTVQEQYDLHLAIIDKTPYAWIDPTPTGTLAGEIIPGTDVYLLTDTGRIRANVDEHRFALPDEPGKIEIERSTQRATVVRP
jgi:hypothetical protein